jgi:hypothetical protein
MYNKLYAQSPKGPNDLPPPPPCQSSKRPQKHRPPTALGKRHSSRNAVRHGISSFTPVLLPRENPAAWEKFAKAVLVDLQSAGPVEAMWAGRIALLLWRLRRAAEARNTLADQQWREAEASATQTNWWHHRRQYDPAFPSNAASARRSINKMRQEKKLLDRVTSTPLESDAAASLVDSGIAVRLIEWAVDHLSIRPKWEKAFAMKNKFPSIGRLTRQPDPELYTWSIAQVRQALTEVAALVDITLDGLIVTLIPALTAAYNQTRSGYRRAQREIRHYRLNSAAKSIAADQTLDRYEAELERSLTRSLAQLRLLQAKRAIETSPILHQARQNRVALGFAAIQLPEK